MSVAAVESRQLGKRYFCPMCGGVESDTPGSCPKCGMALERNPVFREPKKIIYTCPMHPQIEQDRPGNCPICGMTLEPKTVGVGDTVGYGATWLAVARTPVATIAVGYADGVSRARSNRGHVLIRGHRAPLIGVVSDEALQFEAEADRRFAALAPCVRRIFRPMTSPWPASC